MFLLDMIPSKQEEVFRDVRVRDSLGCSDREMQRVQNSSVQDCELKLLSREIKATSGIIAPNFRRPEPVHVCKNLIGYGPRVKRGLDELVDFQ